MPGAIGYFPAQDEPIWLLATEPSGPGQGGAGWQETRYKLRLP